MNVQKLREVLKPFRSQNVITAYPVALDSDGEIIVPDAREPKPILRTGTWRGKVSLFYEEKPMFVAILMSNESLCNTAICDTRKGAIDAAVKFVNMYDPTVDLRDTVREYLETEGAYSFSGGGFNYTVHVGEAS